MSQQQHSPSPSEATAARPLRPLLPAASPRNDTPATQSKRARVSLACAACRSRKTKCNGGRPQCSECVSRDSPCHFTETETTQTKRKHVDLEELFELLKSLPDDDASKVLSWIRTGVEPREIVETIQHGNMLMQFASASGSESRSRHGSGSGSVSGQGSCGGSGDSGGQPGRDSGSPTK